MKNLVSRLAIFTLIITGSLLLSHQTAQAERVNFAESSHEVVRQAEYGVVIGAASSRYWGSKLDTYRRHVLETGRAFELQRQIVPDAGFFGRWPLPTRWMWLNVNAEWIADEVRLLVDNQPETTDLSIVSAIGGIEVHFRGNPSWSPYVAGGLAWEVKIPQQVDPNFGYFRKSWVRPIVRAGLDLGLGSPENGSRGRRVFIEGRAFLEPILDPDFIYDDPGGERLVSERFAAALGITF